MLAIRDRWVIRRQRGEIVARYGTDHSAEAT
jgi:hypothetical protein